VARLAAKVVREGDIRRLLAKVSNHRNPERNVVVVLLSFKAGLRACEIAGLRWPMVLGTNGRVTAHADVSRGIAKYGSGRRILFTRSFAQRCLPYTRRRCSPLTDQLSDPNVEGT
jgi:integrase/recombinase XerC